MNKTKLLLALIGLTLVCYAVVASNKVPEYKVEVVNTYPHDSKAFTQGLIYHDGFLYESTGLRGESSLRKIKIETGEVLKKRDLNAKFFGEGLAIWKEKLIQLTWHAGIAFICNIDDLNATKAFAYSGEGWGLTTNADGFILSDGSADLSFRDPETFQEVKRITVKDGDKSVKNLNELEFIKGEIYANIWMKNKIARINPNSGFIIGWIDLEKLVPPEHKGSEDAVLNGIAYDHKNDRLFVTGKLWSKLYEIKIDER